MPPVTDTSTTEDDLRCIEFAEMVSAYVDGEFDDRQNARIARHLESCPGCRAMVEQFETVKRLTGALSAADVANVDPLIRDRLMATLRIPRRR
jgi:anti-sigma factor RsiW